MALETLNGPARSETSADVRARVCAARERQRQRYQDDGIRTNSELTPTLLARDCHLEPAAVRILTLASRRLGLSARGYDRARKVARTIADLAADERVSAEHVAESLQFRC